MDGIYIKYKEDVLLFCPFCGKQELHQCSTDFDLMSCSNCKNTFAMIKEKAWENLKLKIQKYQ